MSKARRDKKLLTSFFFNHRTEYQKNPKENFTIRNIFKPRNIIKMIKYIFITNLFIQLFQSNKVYLLEYNSSVITLKIIGTGTKNIFCQNTSYFGTAYYPNEVIINGVTKNEITYSYNFDRAENDVELKWDGDIIVTRYMFYRCSNISEINFSNFNTSKVSDMNGMFVACSSLTSLDLSNFDTSKVTDMDAMFYNCTSLRFLDISNFDTSQVTNMGNMFFNCPRLTSLDVSGFNTANVKGMVAMFYNCVSLPSLNILNFDTSKVTNIYAMFDNCFSLPSLNLSNFNTSQVKNMNGVFYNCKSLTSLNLSNFDTSKVEDFSGMFFGCSSLTSLNLSNFDTSNAIKIGHMFRFCSSLKSLDLSNFNTSKAEDMQAMFYNCTSLEFINISSFKTSKVKDMGFMFRFCSSLKSLDISNFDTSQSTSMKYMFSDCSSLTSLDTSNFDTSNVKNFAFMFNNCSSLTSLNLLSFDTSKISDMEHMFYNCRSLSSLDLSTFNTARVYWMDNMFEGCLYLEYINMKNFQQTVLYSYNDIFKGIPDNVVMYINSQNNAKIISKLLNSQCYTIYYSNNFEINPKKIIDGTSTCIADCNSHETYTQEYNGKCYENCPNGIISDNICKCELEKCLYCPNVPLSKVLCTQCNANYYKIENDPFNIGEYINCYKDPKGYYLDKNDLVYKKCYESCETCEIGGDNITHNCLKCNEDYSNNQTFNNYTNCYKNCSYYHYFDNNNHYHCTINSTCPNEYPTLIKDKYECFQNLVTSTEINIINSSITNTIQNLIDSYIKKETEEIPSERINHNIISQKFSTELFIKSNNITDILGNIISAYIKNETGEQSLEEIKYYDMILKNIEKIFTSEEYDTTNLENGNDDIIEIEKLLVTLTTTLNQKNNKDNSKVSTIDLALCEKLLRNNYNLSENETIFIKKLDVKQEGLKIQKIEFDVYSKLFGTTLVKLNLTVCENTKIYIHIPVNISENENLDVLNTSSGYYNDICYTTTSESGTDITLKDRKADFIEENKTVCQEDCEFIEYFYDSNKVNCECQIKPSSSSYADMKIDIKKIFENFIDFENIANLKILICFEQLFTKEGIVKNIGCYIIIIIVFIHIINIFVFYLFQMHILKIQIDILFIKNKTDKSKNVNEKQKNNSNEKPINENIGEKIGPSFKEIKKIQNMNDNSDNTHNNNKNRINLKKSKNSTTQTSIDILNSNSNKHDLIKESDNPVFSDEELNSLSYDKALIHDQRTYWQYYISLIKTKHDLIFSFYTVDFNSRIIKIDLYFNSFVMNYTVNALFFSDDTMHKIYKSNGSYDFLFQLPIIIYSTLISYALNFIQQSLALPNDDILDLKKDKSKNRINKKKKLLHKLRIKFILYFIISSIFLLFFWYYLSMFGVIYKNTQIHLLNDTLISFVISLFSPFVIYLFPGIFRIPALNTNKGDRKYLYNFSKILQWF